MAFVWVVLIGMHACTHSVAQQGFRLGVVDSPDPVVANRTLTYTLFLTNRAGSTLTNVLVTNRLPVSAQFISATNSFGTVFNSPGLVRFRISLFPDDAIAVMSLNVRPTAFGNLTNNITVSTTFFTNLAPTITTNIVTEVIAAQADLELTLSGPAPGALVNDWIVYSLTVTNRGSDIVPNVRLSNSLPANVTLIGISPTNISFSRTNDALSFSLGSLPGGSGTRLTITAQPTNAGPLTISAHVSAASLLETNTANNTATTNITVGDFLAGELTAEFVSDQRYEPQTGLMEQTVRLSNAGSNPVAAARVIVSGLSNRLYNAVGTNSGNPFVVHANPLAAGELVDLLFEYFVPARVPFPVTNSQLRAVEVPAVDFRAPTNVAPNITGITLSSNRVLIEFQSVPGASYTIVYSDDMSFNNALLAQPPVVAPADRTQWIDDGPPKTISPPMDAMSRLYRVIQNP